MTRQPVWQPYCNNSQLEPLQEDMRFTWLVFLYKTLNEQVAVPPDKLDLIVNADQSEEL